MAFLLGFLVVVQIRAQGGGSDLENRTAAGAHPRRRQPQHPQRSARGRRSPCSSSSWRPPGRPGPRRKLGRRRSGPTSRRVRAWSGMSGVTGPGVRVTLRGPHPRDGGRDLLERAAQCRRRGAQRGRRPRRAGHGRRRRAGRALGREHAARPGPESWRPSGHSAARLGRSTRAGGIVAQLEATYPDISVEVTPVDRSSCCDGAVTWHRRAPGPSSEVRRPGDPRRPAAAAMGRGVLLPCPPMTAPRPVELQS